MKTLFKSLIILFIIIHFAIYSYGGSNFPPIDSNANKHIPTIAFALHPLYTIESGFRVDFETRITKNQWLIVGPQYFIAENKSMDFFTGLSNNMDMEGYGIDIYHKIILKSEETVKGPYAAYGLRYNVFNFKTESGIYSIPKKLDVTNTRYGFNVLFGYQNVINDKLLVDIYTGCGIQISKLKGDDGTFEDQSNFFMNYSYSGPRFLLGFRIGMFLN
jgi:hypothetical protein